MSCSSCFFLSLSSFLFDLSSFSADRAPPENRRTHTPRISSSWRRQSPIHVAHDLRELEFRSTTGRGGGRHPARVLHEIGLVVLHNQTPHHLPHAAPSH